MHQSTHQPTLQQIERYLETDCVPVSLTAEQCCEMVEIANVFRYFKRRGCQVTFHRDGFGFVIQKPDLPSLCHARF